MIARKMLRNVNNLLRFINDFLRFINDFEPRISGPFPKYPARIAKDLRSVRNQSRPIKSMLCRYLREISNDPSSGHRFNNVPTQTPRKPRSPEKCYGMLITPNLPRARARHRFSLPTFFVPKESRGALPLLLRYEGTVAVKKNQHQHLAQSTPTSRIHRSAAGGSAARTVADEAKLDCRQGYVGDPLFIRKLFTRNCGGGRLGLLCRGPGGLGWLVLGLGIRGTPYLITALHIPIRGSFFGRERVKSV